MKSCDRGSVAGQIFQRLTRRHRTRVGIQERRERILKLWDWLGLGFDDLSFHGDGLAVVLSDDTYIRQRARRAQNANIAQLALQQIDQSTKALCGGVLLRIHPIFFSHGRCEDLLQRLVTGLGTGDLGGRAARGQCSHLQRRAGFRGE